MAAIHRCAAVTARNETLSELLLRVMLDLAMRQRDPADRDAMLAILKKDGWL